MITFSSLKELMRDQESYVTSIYLPVYEVGVRDRERDRIRLRNLIDRAETDLTELGVDRKETESRLKPARGLLQDMPFWQHQGQGLAVFIAPGQSSQYWLPISVPELSVTSRSFHIKPLVPLVGMNQSFYILKTSLNLVRLYRADLENIVEVDSKSIPVDITQALGTDDAQRQLQNHVADTGGGPASGAIFHGHGAAKDQQEVDMARFVRAIAKGVNKEIKGASLPLLFAGDNKLFSLYREMRLQHELLPEHLSGNFDTTKPHELHQQALGLISSDTSQGSDTMFERFQALEAKDARLAPSKLEDVVQASFDGRIGQLLYDNDAVVWGTTNPKGKITRQKARKPGSVDLINTAISHTLSHGGEVYPLGGASDNLKVKACAILRY